MIKHHYIVQWTRRTHAHFSTSTSVVLKCVQATCSSKLGDNFYCTCCALSPYSPEVALFTAPTGGHCNPHTHTRLTTSSVSQHALTQNMHSDYNHKPCGVCEQKGRDTLYISSCYSHNVKLFTIFKGRS